MNFEYPKQIKAILNLLNENYSGFKYENGVNDPLFYIKGPKINIKFINSKYEVTKVNIPKSITQYDLYTLANLYKIDFRNNNILLIHKNKILNKDDSSIDIISNNDNVIIIEPRYFPDDSYYNNLMKKSSNAFSHVRLTLSNGKRLYKVFPTDITIGEMCKAFFLMLGSSNYDYFLYGGLKINLNDKRQLKEFGNFSLEIISTSVKGSEINILGKQINIFIYSNEKTMKNHHYPIGILNKIEDIMIYYEPIVGKRIKKIKIGEIEIKKDENKRLCSLLSLGITKDFDCYIEFGEKFNF